MSDNIPSKTTIGCAGAVTVRQRPALMLMKVRLRAAEPTLELGLARLKKQSEATGQWLKRLGADRVDVGEPHFADQADTDPIRKMQAMAAKSLRKRPSGGTTEQKPHGVCVVLTAMWLVAAMSAEEILVLVDRLRFEVAEDSDESDGPDPLPPWASPEEQMQAMMSQMQQPGPEDDSPQFVFISRLSDEQREKALAEAVARARQNAERIARAAGVNLGSLQMLHHMGGLMEASRPDRLMDRQRCLGLLAGSSYDLGENEIVSDDLRAAEFTVSVNVSYSVES